MTLLTIANIDSIVLAARTTHFAVEFETTQTSIRKSCEYCDGEGHQTCCDCEGEGRVMEGWYSQGCGEWIETGRIECPACDGEGTTECEECDGERGGTAFAWGNIHPEHCGYELVTGKMSWEKWNANRRKIGEDLTDYVYVDYTTGGHTHIDWTRFHSLDTLQSILVLVRKLNRTVHEELEIDEERADDSYCQKYDPNSWNEWEEDQTRYFNEGRMSWGSRYRWVNLTNIGCSSKNTVEFRIFDSTDSIVQAEQNVAWAQAFMHYANTYTPEEIRGMDVDDIYADLKLLKECILSSVNQSVYTEPQRAVEMRATWQAEQEAASTQE